MSAEPQRRLQAQNTPILLLATTLLSFLLKFKCIVWGQSSSKWWS